MIVKEPSVSFSKPNLDFGAGFYVTTVKEQAERWAQRKAMINNQPVGYLNVYNMANYNGRDVKDFGDDLDEWLEFICKCRSGEDIYAQYAIIKGKVADDKVYNVVEMYKNHVRSKKETLEALRINKLYSQICLTDQAVINSILKFKDAFEVIV